jgi:signal transduction histidine kinase/frataxin-like iron-binding protein CyaY
MIIPDRDNANILWVGTDTGLVKFDMSSRKWIKFRHDPNNPDSIDNDTMWHLFMDNAGFIWIPTYGGGLDKFDPKTEKVVTHYKNNPDDPQSLGSDTLNHVYEDSAGRIWVGTVGSGLNKLNPDGTFTRYNEETGFLTNWVGSIIEDNQGLLWLGTKIGLIKFDPKTETWRLYTQDDGLQSNEFLEYPNFKAPDGELWVFGGNGLNSFYPDKLKDNTYKPPVYFTALTQGNEPLKDVKQAPERLEEITLNWQNNFFEFEVAALNFTKPEKNQYRYFLEGFDKEWYNAGTKRTGRYSNLPDGTYTLRVRGSNNDGVWSDQEATLKVTVVGPFWRTTWFTRLVAFAAILGITGEVLRRRQKRDAQNRAAEERQRDLARQVAERTALLETANRELEAFAYSISHDLRAPLRHIDGFIDMLQKRVTNLDEKSQHYMDVIAESARRMGMLIDDLLSFSRTGRDEIVKSQVDLNELVQDVIHETGHETEDRNIQWKIASLPVVTGDRAMLRIVLVNLVSNALKFTRAFEPPQIEIGSTENPNEVVIFIRDNGVGFDMKYVDKLFGVFQRLHRQEDFEGTGIGLANVRRIIHRHGGRTWAEGQVDHGATFYFSLPITN